MEYSKSRLQFLVASITVAILSITNPAHAVTDYIWQGDVSANPITGGNWDLGSRPNRGDSNAVFNDPTVEGLLQPIADGSQLQPQSITFNQAGWYLGEVNGGSYALWTGSPFLTSNGEGTNRISVLRTAGTGPVTVGVGNTLVIEGDSGGISFSEKNGGGTLIGGGVWDQFPVLNAGSLILNGSIQNNGSGFTRDILAGSLVGGSGSIEQTNGTTARGYVFKSGSTFAPGFTGNTQAAGSALATTDTQADTFTLLMDRNDGFRNNIYTMELGSTMAISLFDDGTSDSLYVTGTSTDTGSGRSYVSLDLETGVTLALSGTVAYDTDYTIALFDGAGTFTGTFDSVTLNGLALVDGVDYSIVYNPHTAFDPGSGSIVVNLVPEPGSIGLLGMGLLVVLSRRRRA